MHDKTDITVLKHLMIINLDVSIWTARKKLTAADFNGAKLPPEELASLGSKKICNPDDLRIFSTLKSRAVSTLDKVGVRFLNGWAIPQEKAEQVITDLNKIRNEFIDAKQQFLSTYDRNILDWVERNLEWKELIQNSLVGADHVSSRLGFKWQLYQVVPPKKKFIHDELKDEIAELGLSLYGEIAKAAEDTWKKCYSGKSQVSQKAVSPLRAIYEKLNGLSFVEPCAAPICNLLETAFKQLPDKGFIKDANLLMLQGVLALLRDPVTLVNHGKQLIEGAYPETVLSQLIDATGSDNDEFIPELHHPQQPIESLGLW